MLSNKNIKFSGSFLSHICDLIFQAALKFCFIGFFNPPFDFKSGSPLLSLPSLSLIGVGQSILSYLSWRPVSLLIWRNIINNKSKIRHNMDMEQSHTASSLVAGPLTDHHFILRGSETTHLQSDVIVDFQPVKALDPSISAHHFITFSITPTFNQDGKYYTTAFLNPFDDEQEEDDKMMTQHQTKVREFSTEIPQNDILLPKPRQMNPFCCVCKQVYRDYLEHINTDKHQKSIKSSQWGRMIEDLVEERFPKVRRSQRINFRRK